jgi:hypothetical protein
MIYGRIIIPRGEMGTGIVEGIIQGINIFP